MSHKLSHPQSHTPELQIHPQSHLPLSINSLQSHMHFSLFQHLLSLQTLAFNLHSHLKISCLASVLLDIRLNTLIFMFLPTPRRYNFASGSLILLQLPLHLFISKL